VSVDYLCSAGFSSLGGQEIGRPGAICKGGLGLVAYRGCSKTSPSIYITLFLYCRLNCSQSRV
jgi:hypothetical protein